MDEKKLEKAILEHETLAKSVKPTPLTGLIFDIASTDFYRIEACKTENAIIYHIDPVKKLDDNVWFRALNRVIRAVLMQPFFPSIYYYEKKITIDRLPNVVNSIAVKIDDLSKHPSWKIIHNQIMESLKKEFSRFDDPNVPNYIAPQLNKNILDTQKKFLSNRSDLKRINL